MRKRLLVLVAVLALACSLVPGVAFSDEGTADVAVTIEIGASGVPVDASGTGWNYDGSTLTLEAGHAFIFTGGTLTVDRTSNSGTIKDGTISGGVSNLENATITGGTFSGYVYNYGIISGGTFNKGSGMSINNYVDSRAGGTIRGGEFNIGVNNSGTIEDGAFNDGAQNYVGGTISGGTFGGMTFFNYGIISDGVFSSETTYNLGGEIHNGTFGKAVESSGTIAGGTFTGVVTNYDTIEGGFFAHSIVDEGGTVSTCSYPMSVNLTGLAIKTGESTPPVIFEKDGTEDNTFTLVADKDYTLPGKIALHRDAATGAELVAGTDYTYNAATGTITIKKSAVPGPLYLVASGTPVPTPPSPEDDPSKPTPLPGPTEPEKDSAPATTLAATGDSALPQTTLGIVLLAGSVLVTCSVTSRKQRSKRP